MRTVDAVIIGSGHNALITATRLARAGWDVCVAERNDDVGGATRSVLLDRDVAEADASMS